jgi:hypothetical protein
LLARIRNGKFESFEDMLIKMLDCRTSQIVIEKFTEDIGFQDMENVAMLKGVIIASKQKYSAV